MISVNEERFILYYWTLVKDNFKLFAVVFFKFSFFPISKGFLDVVNTSDDLTLSD